MILTDIRTEVNDYLQNNWPNKVLASKILPVIPLRTLIEPLGANPLSCFQALLVLARDNKARHVGDFSVQINLACQKAFSNLPPKSQFDNIGAELWKSKSMSAATFFLLFSVLAKSTLWAMKSL
jgi:hypothetical protein